MIAIRILLATYPVFLLLAVGCLADADAETLVADSLVGALPHGLTSMIGKIARHLWGHGCQGQHIAAGVVVVNVLLEATQGRDWQLKGTSRCLGDLHRCTVSRMSLITGCSKHQRCQHTWLCHELRLERVEA